MNESDVRILLRRPASCLKLPLGSPSPRAFHERLPGYRRSPLVPCARIATKLGVAHAWVKDESGRFGLPAFKILGASWATFRALGDRLGVDPATVDLGAIRALLTSEGRLTLATATDGNHGRAVARVAQWLRLRAIVLVPAHAAAARIEAIRGEGAKVVCVAGSYDDAVAEAAALESDQVLVVSDTAWPGYAQIPQWVIDGYATIFEEVDAELHELSVPSPDVVSVQVGVGALAAAAARHYAPGGVRLVCVEPMGAACMLWSAESGKPVTIPGPHTSIMAGLNCGRPSDIAWPVVSQATDLFVAISDRWAKVAMRLLAGEGIVSGESGAASLGGLLAALESQEGNRVRSHLGITSASSVLLISTEGATDPAAYRQIVNAEASRSELLGDQ